MIYIMINCHMSSSSSEIIQSVAYDNYDDFQHISTSHFHKNSFHYFQDYF
jgi:hypothetical protein